MPEEKRRIDVLIDALFQALPASSYREIRSGMSKFLGERINLGEVNNTLHHLRKNVDEYGWMVSYVKRGRITKADKNRFFAMLQEKDGSFSFDPQHRQHFDNGSYATVTTVETHTRNLAAMLKIATQYESIRARRDEFDEARENLEFIARKLERMRKKMAA